MMKKIRQILALVLITATVPASFSQDNVTADCTIKYNLFKGDYQAKKYDASFDNWMWCMDNCPKLSVNIYKLGIKVAMHKLSNASEQEKPDAIELVERVYTQRMAQNFKNDDMARIYSDLATFKASVGGDDEEVFTLLQKSFKINPTSMSPKNTFKYFDMILNKFKDTDTQKVFDTYDEVGEGIEKKRAEYFKKIDIINAKDSTTLSAKDKKNRDIYQKLLGVLVQVEGGLDAKLAAISTCERLIPFNQKNFEEFKGDAVWLKRAVSRMYNKECTEDPFYDTLVEAYVNADPSPDASVFYAGILMKKGEDTKAMEYFKKAVEQETDSYKKAKNLLTVAQILSKKGRRSEARSYANQALANAPTMGKAYLIIAGMYAKSANSCGTDIVSKRMVYVAAYDKALKAKSVDPSISKLANRYLKNYLSNMPSKKDLFVAGIDAGTPFKIGCWIGETVRVRSKD
jgi:tetratricopeptide (TPR) repeat protein